MLREDRFHRVKSYVDLHFTEKIYTGTLAQIAGHGRQYFSKLFKARTGMAPQQFIIKTRLNYAKFLRDSGEETALAIVAYYPRGAILFGAPGNSPAVLKGARSSTSRLDRRN